VSESPELHVLVLSEPHGLESLHGLQASDDSGWKYWPCETEAMVNAANNIHAIQLALFMIQVFLEGWARILHVLGTRPHADWRVAENRVAARPQAVWVRHIL
jgi:hypothetical protein